MEKRMFVSKKWANNDDDDDDYGYDDKKHQQMIPSLQIIDRDVRALLLSEHLLLFGFVHLYNVLNY